MNITQRRIFYRMLRIHQAVICFDNALFIRETLTSRGQIA